MAGRGACGAHWCPEASGSSRCCDSWCVVSEPACGRPTDALRAFPIPPARGRAQRANMSVNTCTRVTCRAATSLRHGEADKRVTSIAGAAAARTAGGAR
jgi:hypothetical protein